MIDKNTENPGIVVETAPPVAFVKDLRVRYGKFEAVRGISFEIPKGEVFGFIGPNGAGKSSTIRVLATLQKQFEGTVRVNGISVRKDPDQVREMMGYVPASSASTMTSVPASTCTSSRLRIASRAVVGRVWLMKSCN